MLAVDTNVVVRLLVKDDPGQYKRALYLFNQEDIFLAKTVLLETEWVLRFTYRLGTQEVAQALVALIELPNVWHEGETEVHQALAWYQAGMDFADALHLAASARATRFATFDRDMIKIAKRLDLAVSAP
jgi:predicted nucleic-acid-binding protein